MSFIEVPVATTRETLISNGLLFATGINWGGANTERGIAYRTQDIYIGANISAVYVAAYPFTDPSISQITYRLALCSYNSYTGYITPSVYDDVSQFSESGQPNFDEINVYSLMAGIPIYPSFNDLKADFMRIYGKKPITYRPTNCSFPGAPTEAAVGDTVVVPVTFPDGYGLVNESNIYVTNNRVAIPSTYSNGQLTFTMPDPT